MISNRLVLVFIICFNCAFLISIVQSCDPGDYEVVYHDIQPPEPPKSPPPEFGTLWADMDKGCCPIRNLEWAPDGNGIAFVGWELGEGTKISFLKSDSQTEELLVSLDPLSPTIVDIDQSNDGKLYYQYEKINENYTLAVVDLQTKESKILVENMPRAGGGNTGFYEDFNMLEVSPDNQYVYINLWSGSMTIDLKTLESQTRSNILGHFTAEKPNELVLLHGNNDTGFFWRFENMDSGVFKDVELPSLFPGMQSNLPDIIDFSWVNNEMNLRWKRSPNGQGDWPYYAERFLTNSKTGDTYYSHIELSPGGSDYYNNHYSSKSLNKCIVISHVLPGTDYNRQIILKDFEKGTETVLAQSVPMNWYKYNNFSFSDDETKIAFSFIDTHNSSEVRSIYWMEIDP